MKNITRKSILEKTAMLMAIMGIPRPLLERLQARTPAAPLQRVMDLEAVAESDGTWVLEIPGCRDSNKYFYLNETAREVWELIDSRNSLDDISTEISRRYSLSPGEARNAVEPLILSMKEQNLVV